MKFIKIRPLLLAVGLLISSMGVASADIGTDLLNYWDFEGNFEDTAGKALGTGSSKNDTGTPAAAANVTITPGGPLGRFVKLNRSNIRVPNSDDVIAAGESLTISAWFRVNTFNSSWQALIAHGEGSDYRIARQGGSQNMSYAGGTGDIGGPPNVTDTAWHHVVAISEAAVSTRLWVDGELVATGGAPNLTNNGAANLQIGGNPNAGGRDWDGDVDDVAMWSRALTDDEITSLYTKSKAGIPLSAQFTLNPLPLLGGATLSGNTVSVTYTDSATGIVDVAKTRSMLIDSIAVTPTVISKAGAVTTLSYTKPTPFGPGALLTIQPTVTTTTNQAVTGTRTVRTPFASILNGGGEFATQHVWTRGNPQIGDVGAAEAALDDPSAIPAEDQITVKTRYIHFHDNALAPYFQDDSRAYPLWDAANGGTGPGDRNDYAIRSKGTISLKTGGTCWFICNSDDGFSLKIDGAEIGNAGNRGRGNTIMSVDLTAGFHEVNFVHWERGGGAGVSVYIHKGVALDAPPADADSYELLQAWLNPADSDNDGMLDSYETANGLNPAVNDAALDKDSDGLTNLQESKLGTRADIADTDGDGLSDKVETNTGIYVSATNTGTNPLNRDTDKDGLADGVENNSGTFVSATNPGTNPFKADTDGDGLDDASEVRKNSNPLVAGGGIDFGLVGYWPMDSTYNSTINGHTSVAEGGDPEFVDGKFGKAIKLTGGEHLRTEGDENEFDFAGGSMSVSVWFTADAIDTSWQCLIAKGEGGGWRVHRRGGDNPPQMAFTGGSAGDTPAHTTEITLDVVHHMLAVSEKGVGTKLYFDGVLVSEGPASVLENRGNPMMIGENPDAANRKWKGNIDDVAIWCRPLKATEVASIWNGGTGKSIGSFLTPPVETIPVTNFSYNAATSVLNLSFGSVAGTKYALEYTTGFLAAGAPASPTKWNIVPGYSSITGAAGSTAITPLNTSTLVTPTGLLPNNSKSFFRIRRL